MVDDVDLAVDQLGGLRLDRGHDLRVAVAGVGDADATGEVEVTAARGVIEATPRAVIHHDVRDATQTG